MTTPAQRDTLLQPTLVAKHITVGYGDREILHDVSLTIPEGSLTVIVGPNACGKSTLLRTLSRMLKPTSGRVTLNGTDIRSQPTRQVAQLLALLPQTHVAPDGITVQDLVGRGRYPHQGVLRQWSDADQHAVDHAMELASVTELADRKLAELSGGQRQRVWIAMVLAQETPLLLLDEPTTYLDISHQVEVLNLAAQLRDQGKTVVVVLHELNLAFRYATHLVVMRDGHIIAEGTPRKIVTAELIRETYGLPCRIIGDPESHTPLVVPLMNGTH